MKLERIYVRQLRQFREALEIGDLGAGLNLFSGPNESGKSSLVRAIRAAFFERHISKSVGDLRPWGDSSASPYVELDFSVDGKSWHLTKSFLSQKRCDLTIEGQAFSGEEAEDKLADLLGFQMPLRGASKAEQWGIPGLLWIEQGSGQEVRQPVSNAAQHLKSALAASVGEVASSSGDWVTELVKKERAVLLTNTGRPTAEYARAIAEQGQLQAELAELTDKVTRYQDQVDRLGELRAQQQADAGRPWLRYRQRQVLEQEKLKQVEALINEQARDESARQACLDMLQVLEQQLQQHQSQAENLAQRRQALEQAAAQVQRLEAQTPARQVALASSQESLAQARAQLNQARQHEQRRQWQEESERLGPEIAGLQEQLDSATQLQQQLATMLSRLQQLALDPQQLERLQALHDEHRELTLQQQSIATRLQFDLLPQQSISLDDEKLQAQGERLLLQPARLTIPGVGQLTIQPGGKDLSELAREQQRLQDDLQAQMQLMQVTSLQQARQQAQQAKSLDDEIRLSRKMLQALLSAGSTPGKAADTATGGVDRLRELLQSRQQAQQLLQEKIERLPAVDADTDDTDTVPPTLQVAEQKLEREARALREAENAASSHATELKLAGQSLEAAQAELQGLQQSLESPQRQQQQRQEREQAEAQQARALQLSKAMEARAEQIAAAQPQALRDEIQRLGAAADNLETAASQRQAEVGRLQTILETLGAQGLEEELGAKQAEQQRLQRRVEQLQRRAEALDLLLQLLNSKRQQLTQRLQAPLQKHINHYLQLLFPGASLQVDENLMPQQLIRAGRRGEEHHDIEALSFGAREQMGLISRLAYADLLREAGRPTLIILDDALVHSDAQRLEQMKRILFDAARRHQLLLFTCHPDNWRDLGVPREMQGLAQA